IQPLSTFACDAHGNPDGAVAADDVAVAYFYCKLNTNDKSPETVQGGYFVVKTILCAIGTQITLSFPDVATEQAVTLDFDNDSCFSELGETGSMPLYVTQQAISGTDS